MRSQLVAAVIPFVVGMLLGMGPRAAVASSWLVVSGCDSVNVGGVVYPRVTFALHDAYPEPEYPICTVGLRPVTPQSPGDSCTIIGGSAPADWAVYPSDGYSDVLIAHLNGNNPCIEQGETVSGFQFILSKAHNCCYEMYIYGALLEPFAQDEVCFTCDRPVPARLSSWGAMKSLYRE